MAHHRDIPVAYSYLSDRRSWHLYEFDRAEPPKTFGEAYALTSPLTPFFRSGGPTLLSEPAFTLRLKRTDDMLATLRDDVIGEIYSQEIKIQLEAAIDFREAGQAVPECVSQVLVSWPGDGDAARELNPWQMREDFLQLPETNDALSKFLNQWGMWDHEGFLHERGIMQTRIGVPLPAIVLPALVWKRRGELREGMLGKADSWLAERAKLGFTHRRGVYPYFGMTDRTCSAAIETTITLDHLQKTRWRTCKRPDCDNIFAVESDHGKVYCQQYCGHIVSVRRKRAAAKRAAKSKQGKRA